LGEPADADHPKSCEPSRHDRSFAHTSRHGHLPHTFQKQSAGRRITTCDRRTCETSRMMRRTSPNREASSPRQRRHRVAAGASYSNEIASLQGRRQERNRTSRIHTPDLLRPRHGRSAIRVRLGEDRSLPECDLLGWSYCRGV
jgi:hypothetical protein